MSSPSAGTEANDRSGRSAKRRCDLPEARTLVPGPVTTSRPAWSPDGKRARLHGSRRRGRPASTSSRRRLAAAVGAALPQRAGERRPASSRRTATAGGRRRSGRPRSDRALGAARPVRAEASMSEFALWLARHRRLTAGDRLDPVASGARFSPELRSRPTDRRWSRRLRPAWGQSRRGRAGRRTAQRGMRVARRGRQPNRRYSPDGSRLAFVRDRTQPPGRDRAESRIVRCRSALDRHRRRQSDRHRQRCAAGLQLAELGSVRAAPRLHRAQRPPEPTGGSDPHRATR